MKSQHSKGGDAGQEAEKTYKGGEVGSISGSSMDGEGQVLEIPNKNPELEPSVVGRSGFPYLLQPVTSGKEGPKVKARRCRAE